MATLYVDEFQNLGFVSGVAQIALMPPKASQLLAIGAGSVQSNPFGDSTNFIRVHADSICSIAIGNNPTAVTTAMRMAADQTEYFGVKQGDKIAVIANS